MQRDGKGGEARPVAHPTRGRASCAHPALAALPRKNGSRSRKKIVGGNPGWRRHDAHGRKTVANAPLALGRAISDFPFVLINGKQGIGRLSHHILYRIFSEALSPVCNHFRCWAKYLFISNMV